MNPALDPENDPREKRRCEHCGERYILTKPTRKFCTERCRNQHYLVRHPRVEKKYEDSAGPPAGRWKSYRESREDRGR